jgi:hypothetical protein
MMTIEECIGLIGKDAMMEAIKETENEPIIVAGSYPLHPTLAQQLWTELCEARGLLRQALKHLLPCDLQRAVRACGELGAVPRAHCRQPPRFFVEVDMSLRDSVREICSQMEAEAKELEEHGKYDETRTLGLYRRMLEVALKASEGEDLRPLILPAQNGLPPGQYEADLMRRAREEARAAKQRTDSIERHEGMAAPHELVGGTADGTMAPFPDGAPAGAKTVVEGQVYVLGEDRKLRFSQEETERLAAARHPAVVSEKEARES